MILPLQVTFREIEPNGQAEAWVQEAAQKLDQVYPKITSCRVTIEEPHQHRQRGNPYQVRIELSVPGKELTVTREPKLPGSPQRVAQRNRSKRLEIDAPYKDLHVAIRDAFKAARRQLQDYVRLQRRELKTHETTPRARVARLVPEEDYGFLTAPDGREIYFHRDSVLNDAFDRLKPGSEVIFAEEEGDKGPQASTVKLTRRHQSPYTEKKSRRRIRPFA
jgi:cold shock CspA family protein